MAWVGPYLLLFAALLMEFVPQTSKRINKDVSVSSEEMGIRVRFSTMGRNIGPSISLFLSNLFFSHQNCLEALKPPHPTDRFCSSRITFIATAIQSTASSYSSSTLCECVLFTTDDASGSSLIRSFVALLLFNCPPLSPQCHHHRRTATPTTLNYADQHYRPSPPPLCLCVALGCGKVGTPITTVTFGALQVTFQMTFGSLLQLFWGRSIVMIGVRGNPKLRDREDLRQQFQFHIKLVFIVHLSKCLRHLNIYG
ncbi:unnamed protein product [Lactuca saligna]|uniref:Uncharacterized protein n=1 Tax=Lactuca saligna TaxID=75948 RepID=A0AA35V4T3_LACSI|nr:unnamed protein product [Lactuca saligna]